MSAIAENAVIPAPTPHGRASAGRRARARMIDRVMTGVLWVVVVFLIGVLAYFIGYTIIGGLHVITVPFLTQSDVAGDYDGPEVFNTFYILFLALIVCVPIGVASAVYLIEYARQGIVTTIIRLAVETLAGVPSLILGFFGWLVFVTQFGHGHLWGYSRLAGALTLAILNLPLIVRVSQDAIASVPVELREASEALGATKAQTIFRVLIPYSFPMLTTGVILTAGKMIGETAALIFTTGTGSPVNGWQTLNPLFPGDTLTVHFYELHAEGIARNAANVEAGTAALLLIFLLLFNVVARGLAGLLMARMGGRKR